MDTKEIHNKVITTFQPIRIGRFRENNIMESFYSNYFIIETSTNIDI